MASFSVQEHRACDGGMSSSPRSAHSPPLFRSSEDCEKRRSARVRWQVCHLTIHRQGETRMPSECRRGGQSLAISWPPLRRRYYCRANLALPRSRSKSRCPSHWAGDHARYSLICLEDPGPSLNSASNTDARDGRRPIVRMGDPPIHNYTASDTRRRAL
jgi:hypothetical protein